MTTPNLPPLPDEDVKGVHVDGFSYRAMEGYGSAAYQAGYAEALEQVKARIGAMQNRGMK